MRRSLKTPEILTQSQSSRQYTCILTGSAGVALLKPLSLLHFFSVLLTPSQFPRAPPSTMRLALLATILAAASVYAQTPVK